MKGNRLISIIIVLYNGENLIKETLERALSQTYKNIEIFIVDNNSTDGTWEVLQSSASQDEKIKIFIDGMNNKGKYYYIGESTVYDSEKYIQDVLFDGNYPVSSGCVLFRIKDLKNNLLVDIPNKEDSDFSIFLIGNCLLIFLLTAYQYQNFAFVNEKLFFLECMRDQKVFNLMMENYRLNLIY